MKPAPAHFDGTYSDFFAEFVLPNLPSVERVAELDRRLRHHLSTADPVHVVRMVRGQTRGDIVRTESGGQILPTDNSPVWWLHAFLRSDDPFPDDDAEFFRTLPHHMFGLPKDRRYLNAAGYHAAHLVGAKNGDVDWRNWSREELARRTLVNIHPCNMFLVAKTDWAEWGGSPAILRWVARAYYERFGGLMLSFLSDAGVESIRTLSPPDPKYQYGEDNDEGNKQRSDVQNALSVNRAGAPVKRLNRPQIEENLLGTGTTLDIQTLGRRFVVPHDALFSWVEENTDATKSKSWLEGGLYSWPKPSRKMLEFLKSFER